jgi:hypothetical protein
MTNGWGVVCRTKSDREPKNLEKIRVSAALSTADHRWFAVESNPCCRDWRQSTDRLSSDTGNAVLEMTAFRRLIAWALTLEMQSWRWLHSGDWSLELWHRKCCLGDDCIQRLRIDRSHNDVRSSEVCHELRREPVVSEEFYIRQFNFRNGLVKAMFAYLCTSGCCRLRNALLISSDGAATAGKSW